MMNAADRSVPTGWASRPLRSWQFIVGLALITAILVLAEIPRDTWFTTAALSLVLGAIALVFMGAAALLGGRWRVVESVLGGLDRVYLTHKWLAVSALAFASFHLVFQAELRDWDLAPILALPRYTTRLVRQASFVALMLIVVLALNRSIPYSRWRWWHKLSGPLFLIVIAHWLSIRSPVRLDSPAGIWLAAIAALGVAAAVWKLLLYPLLARHGIYRVVTATPGAAGLHLELEPVRGAIAFEPGQFGFLRMKEDGLREPHPFTIAAGGQDGRVHFVIRALGDYTSELVKRTRPGMHAEIHAPYGRFTRDAGAAREVWIAGGVGISPFIAWMTAPGAVHLDRVTLFYLFTPGREFPSADVLDKLATERGMQFVAVPDGPSSPAFAQQLVEIARNAGPASVHVSFCGPGGLLDRVREILGKTGIPDSALRFEYFNFR